MSTEVRFFCAFYHLLDVLGHHRPHLLPYHVVVLLSTLNLRKHRFQPAIRDHCPADFDLSTLCYLIGKGCPDGITDLVCNFGLDFMIAIGSPGFFLSLDAMLIKLISHGVIELPDLFFIGPVAINLILFRPIVLLNIATK